MMTMVLLKRTNAKLDRDVIFVSEAGEESASGLGIGYLVSDHFSEIEAEACLAEGGGVVRRGGVARFATVQTMEKRPSGARLVAKGPSGHGSRPTRSNAIAIPIQALTIRSEADLRASTEKGSVEAAAPQKDASKAKKNNDELQGVFVVRGKRAEFVPVQTGITGTTDIEVLSGLKEGDEIVTGSYKVLRTMKPGTSIKIDNSAAKKEDNE